MGPPTPQTHRVLHDRHLGAGSTFRKRPAGRANGCGCSIGRGRRAAAPARARPRSIRSPREPWSRASRSRRPPAVPMISPGRADKSYVNRRRAKPCRHPFRPTPKPPRPHRRERRKKLVGTGPRDVEAAGSNIPSSDRHGGALDCVQENDNYPSRLCLARPSAARSPPLYNEREERYLIVTCIVITDVPEALGPLPVAVMAKASLPLYLAFAVYW